MTWIVAGLACLARLPFVGVPAGSDEGGYLAVAAQWAHGTSLYGDYWVDRPPLLIALHALAAALGGLVALRLIAAAGVVASVFLAAQLVRLATGATAAQPVGLANAAAVLMAGVFLSTPLFGAAEVDGELLSVPFVLAGVTALVLAFTADGAGAARGWAVAAGGAAVAAAMVKQNAIDVFVAAVVLVITTRRGGRRGPAHRVALWFSLAAAATTVATLGGAALLGTGPAGIWDAVVTFRFEAATVIGRSATSATPHRLLMLLASAAGSAAPLLVGAFLLRLRRPTCEAQVGKAAVDLRGTGIALVVWEMAAIGGGGSYWLHYLIVLVPGMVVLAAAAAQRPPAWRRLTTVALVLAVASTAAAVATAALHSRDSTDTSVAAYLRAHAQPGDGVVVAFGHPDILWDSGLQSPYAELWSLPVKVRDPRLAAFDAVLESQDAPRWVVVDGTSLGTWGVDATAADRTLTARYHVVTEIGSYYVWRHD